MRAIYPASRVFFPVFSDEGKSGARYFAGAGRAKFAGHPRRGHNRVVVVSDTITRDNAIKALLRRLSAGDTPLALSGLWGSSAPFVAALLSSDANPSILYVCPHLEQADNARDEIETLVGRAIDFLPAWETLPGESGGGSEIGIERARLCDRLRGDSRAIIVAPIQALTQPVPAPAGLDANSMTLSRGEQRSPDEIARWLVARGFTRLDLVEQPGDFALRGGILDIFASADVDPLRIEFFGDQIESIRQFEISSQRSMRELPVARVTRAPDIARLSLDQTTSFLSYLDAGTIVVVQEPVEVAEVAKTVLDRLGNPVGHFPVDAIFRGFAKFRQVHLSRFPVASVPDADALSVRCEALPTFDAKSTDAVRQSLSLARQMRVCVFCESPGEEERLRELFDQVAAESGADPEALDRITIQVGMVHEGFIWRPDGGGDAPDKTVAVIPHHQLFRRYSQVRRIRRTPTGRPIESFLDLQEGDYVVHIVHGIAKFAGMKTMRKSDSRKSEEFLTLRFADDASMHVPASQIDLVQKYIGAKGMRPTLSKLGGTRWQSTKAKVEESLNDLASELLRIQAERGSQEGVSYPEDTHWQREFEDAFLYTETPDQLNALTEIKGDQRRARPMDRLLCGDVGFGKTELAMRAAFKVVEYGKQVAVLVPTTVLAEQHYRTFRDRMADYPFRVECLNRFRSTREQKLITDAARKGQVDVLIGTHRLLSRDVEFSDLGLAIVDEEQRFGVEHKEKLKKLRTTVDVLTLSATPIPRTLHMAMVGLRDISSLATPPMDRRAITTRVTQWNDDMIREALVRELNREGQIYFVHNRVRTLKDIAVKIATLAPDARIVIGHGQMDGEELEEVMLKFIRHEADILVCTTIIEAGLDIPNANTMFIDRADMFGLADLHQLRGRVGRYKHRAYCYLLLSQNRSLTETAARRLKAIEEYSDLGAGFRIAMRDLEIRGAGNILGPEQSGHIAAVGYELFCQLLEKQVKRMRGESADDRVSVHLELDVEAYIPKSYVTSDRQRMDCYRRFAACRTAEDVGQLERDLVDAYGAHPDTVVTMLTLADIRVRAGEIGIQSIIKREPDIVFKFTGDVRKLEPIFSGSAGRASFPDGQTLHWRLPDPYFHGDTLLVVLRNLFRRQSTHLDEKGGKPNPPAVTPRAAVDGGTGRSADQQKAKPREGPVSATRNQYPADAPIHRKRARKRERP